MIDPFATGVTDAGDREQVTVELTGAIAQLRPTAELNPFTEVTVIVEVPEFPTVKVEEPGEAARL